MQTEGKRIAAAFALILVLALAWNIYRAQVESRPDLFPAPASTTPDYVHEGPATLTGEPGQQPVPTTATTEGAATP